MVFNFPFSARFPEVSASLWLIEPILDCVHREKFTPITGRLLFVFSRGGRPGESAQGSFLQPPQTLIPVSWQ